jgi:uncharacterized protein (DUF2236 family)
MAVTREQLEAHLEKITARVRDPRHGLFGPDSMVWSVNREHMIFLAGGRAALLQQAHPFVAQGIEHHSRTRSDPQGRFKRTFKHVYAMVFGDLDSALRAARRVYAMHDRVRGVIAERAGVFAEGSRYDANAEHALLWVHATLWESSIKVYELIFRPLSAEEKERYYQETKLFAYLFGIADDVLPATWNDFLAYNERMWASNELFVGTLAREMQQFLFTPPTPLLTQPAAWYRVMTAALLPPRLREQYGMSYGRSERAIYEASVPLLRALVRLAPRELRYIAAYQEARARIGWPVSKTLAGRLMARAVALDPTKNAA